VAATLKQQKEMYHNPVLLLESVTALITRTNGTYADVTFGGGGHSVEILSRLKNGKLLGFDQDSDTLDNRLDDPRFIFIQGNFAYLKNYCFLHGIHELDGILADLGVSSHQFDRPERGFSTRFDTRLDMRMDTGQEQDAREILNTYPREDLQKIFSRYGELPNAAGVAKRIALERLKKPIENSGQLKEMLALIAPRGKENQFYAQVFQALRIEVNRELDVLTALLEQSAELLVTGGRLVVISYHSLEDRLVKNFINKGKFSGEAEKDLYGNELKPFKSLLRKVVVPSADEIKGNPRARSARMRAGVKISLP